MANTTITIPSAGAIAIAGGQPLGSRGYALTCADLPRVLTGRGALDVWQATASPVFSTSWPPPRWWQALYYSSRKFIRGNVVDSSSAPLVRSVFAIDVTTGFRRDVQISDAGGDFALASQSTDPCFIYAEAASSDQRNNPRFDRVVPV